MFSAVNTQYFVSMLRIVCFEKNVLVKSMISGITLLFPSAQKDVNSKELLVFSFFADCAAFASLITQIFTNIVMNVIVWPLRHNNKLIFESLNPKLLLEVLKRSNQGE